MRLYETQDVDFFVDVPNQWEAYCNYAPDKDWRHKNSKPYKSLNFYRDIEGSRIQKITSKELFLGEKPKNRINEWACLPQLYATGARFIRVEKANPSGFKCAEFPLNVQEMRAKKLELKKIARAEQKERFFEKKLLEECKAARKKESKKTGRPNK